jgi:hypothetical protein
MVTIVAVGILIWLMFAGWVIYRAGARERKRPAPASPPASPSPSQYSALSVAQLRDELGLARGFLQAARSKPGPDPRLEQELTTLIGTIESHLRGRGETP